jgi:hypothetical protein
MSPLFGRNLHKYFYHSLTYCMRMEARYIFALTRQTTYSSNNSLPHTILHNLQS